METKNTSTIWPVQAPCQIAYRDPLCGYFWLRPYVDLQRKGKIWGIAVDGIVYYLKHETNGDWNTALTLKDELSKAKMATTLELEVAFTHKEAFNATVQLLNKLGIVADEWRNGWYWTDEHKDDNAAVIDMNDCHIELVPKRIRNGYVRLTSHYVTNKPIMIGCNVVYVHEGRFKVATDFRPYLSQYLWGLDGGKYYLRLTEEPQKMKLHDGFSLAASLSSDMLKIELPKQDEVEKIIAEKDSLNNALAILSSYGVDVNFVNNRQPYWLTQNIYQTNSFDGFATYGHRIIRKDELCICRLVGRPKGKIEFM